MSRWSRAPALGVALLALAGCAAPASVSRADPAPRVRCLGEAPPGAPDQGPRPLIFLFCVQSP